MAEEVLVVFELGAVKKLDEVVRQTMEKVLKIAEILASRRTFKVLSNGRMVQVSLHPRGKVVIEDYDVREAFKMVCCRSLEEV